jgi:hypothetical protein
VTDFSLSAVFCKSSCTRSLTVAARKPLLSRARKQAVKYANFCNPLLALLVAIPLIAAQATFVQAIEFPYRGFPPQLQERELVWMKNIGIDEITIPVVRGWTEAETAPLIKIARRLGMKLYLRPQSGGPSAGELNSLLATQLVEHGGPVVIGMPQPVARVSLKSPTALQLSRSVILSSRGSLTWFDVEDTRDRSGYHRGAVSFTGDEQQPLTAVLRRDAFLLQYWAAMLPSMRTQKMSFNPRSKQSYPIEVTELTAPDGAAALNLVNGTNANWTGQVGAYYSPAKQHLEIPNVTVNKGDALFLPVNIPLSNAAFCHNCQTLSKNDRIIYATAELTNVEYENGILAMEFYAPTGGEVILQLTSEPSGPYLAGGKPIKFTWDSTTMRARLTIPPGQDPAFRTRIGLALEAPDESAFFVDSHPLVIGQANTIATSYSSPQIAQRSRLILPPNLKATKLAAPPGESPLNINYRVDVPADAVHGDHVQLALEADGAQMGHVRLQLLRPASLRFRQAETLHYGADRELISDPPLISVESPTGRSLDVVVRNNSPEIRSFTLEASCDALQFSPPKTDISIGGSMEREVTLRVFTNDAAPGLHKCAFHLRGAADVNVPVAMVVIPRARTVAYSYDVDADGQPEYVLENQHLRAVFTRSDGGRWLEFVWKDSNRNVLPDNGVELGKAVVELRGSELTVETAAPINVPPGKFGELTLSVDRPKPNATVFSLKPADGG